MRISSILILIGSLSIFLLPFKASAQNPQFTSKECVDLLGQYMAEEMEILDQMTSALVERLDTNYNEILHLELKKKKLINEERLRKKGCNLEADVYKSEDIN